MEKVEENARADSALYQGSYSRPLYIGGERYSISSSSLGEEIDDDDFHSVSSFHSILDESEFYSIRCEQHGAIGKLIVFSEGIRFVRSFPKRELWKRYFTELVEMRKVRLVRVLMLLRCLGTTVFYQRQVSNMMS